MKKTTIKLSRSSTVFDFIRATYPLLDSAKDRFEFTADTRGFERCFLEAARVASRYGIVYQAV